MNIYDVDITVPNVEAETEDEAIAVAREKVQQLEAAYFTPAFIEKKED